MTPSKELEAVARAIYENINPYPTFWDMLCKIAEKDGYQSAKDLRGRYLNVARAALTAIREPTEGMLEAVYERDDDGSGNWEDSFTEAIDYALRDTTGEGE